MASEKYSRDVIVELEARLDDNEKKSGRFSRVQTFDFIRAYRQHECLWNVGIHDYNDKALRYMAIRSIAKDFQLTMDAVKKKIHALRSTYLQMRDKMSEDQQHEPTLSWYYEMEFLDAVITPRKPIELKKIRTKVPRKRTREEILIEDEESLSQSSPMKMETRSQYEEPTGSSEQEEVYIEYIEHQREDESCDVQEDDGTVYTSSVPEAEPTVVAASPPSTTAQDEFDIFGQSVAAQMKTMPLVHAIPLMGRIQSLITEFRLKALTQK